MKHHRPAVLVIAGCDSSGGAGLTRDVQVLTDFSVDTLCVVTAVTAQSDSRVFSIHPIPPAQIRAQMTAALATRPINAIKIGMLANASTVEAVAQTLPTNRELPVVLDPILLSSSGAELLDASGRHAMKHSLFPLVGLLTPNLPEAATLLDKANATDEFESMRRAHELLTLGPKAILLKGGHSDGIEATDFLVTGTNTVHRMTAPRIHATCRGTGCALASAISAGLAHGYPLPQACERAKRYVHAILHNQRSL